MTTTTFKNRYWRARHRIENWAMDAMAWLRGYCNDCPWRPEPGGHGYSFWRCGRTRGHGGLHRFRNYVWDAEGTTTYVPVDYTAADQPWLRNPTLSRRQRRAAEAWHGAAVARQRRAG